MAPQELEVNLPEHAEHEPQGFVRRYIFSMDHKVIGIQYLLTAMFVAIVAGGLPLLKAIVCVGTPAVAETFGLSKIRVLNFSELHRDGHLDRVSISPSRPGVILYSSGTTGPPKGILHTNGGCIRLGRYNAEVMGYGPDDVLWNCFPLFHQNARYTGVIPALDVGAKIVIEKHFSASKFWEKAHAKNVTAFNYLGAVILMLWKQPSVPGDRQHTVTRAFGAARLRRYGRSSRSGSASPLPKCTASPRRRWLR